MFFLADLSDPDVRAIIRAIKKNVREDGRLVFIEVKGLERAFANLPVKAYILARYYDEQVEEWADLCREHPELGYSWEPV